MDDPGLRGAGLPKNDVEAAKWNRLAADLGAAEAQAKLGELYFDGKGVPQSDAAAERYFRLAADQGNSNAQYFLGKTEAK